MNPYCQKSGVALTPWSPLARGILAGAYRGGFDKGTTNRSQGQDRKRTEGLYRGEMDFQIADRAGEIAQKHGKTPAQISLAWLMNKDEVYSPVVGVSKISQLDDLVGAAAIVLEPDDIQYLEALYQPLQNLLSIGFS